MTNLFAKPFDLYVIYTQSNMMVSQELTILFQLYICLKIKLAIDLHNAHHS